MCLLRLCYLFIVDTELFGWNENISVVQNSDAAYFRQETSKPFACSLSHRVQSAYVRSCVYVTVYDFVCVCISFL